MSLVRSEVPQSIRRHASISLERTMGIEPIPSVWKTVMLPLTPRPLIHTGTVVWTRTSSASFGDSRASYAQRLTSWGERRESNSLTTGSQPALAPFEFAHHTARTYAVSDHLELRDGFEPPSSRIQAERSAVDLPKHGALGANRTRDLSDTNRAFRRQNFECSRSGGHDGT